MTRFHASLVDTSVLDSIASFCKTVLAPEARMTDREARFATHHIKALSEMGIMGMNLPTEYGGMGLDPYTLLEAMANISGTCASTGSMVSAHFLCSDSIKFGGSEEQKQKYLPSLASGEKLGAFALTEPSAGSDPASMLTKATRAGDHYHIKGTKHFISNAGAADVFVIYAKTDPAAGGKGVSAFVVEKKNGGITLGKAEPTMGLRGAHAFEFSIDARVPAENRLGDEGSGLRTAMKTLDAGRIDIAMCSVGIAEAAYAAALEWVKTRKMGGVNISTYQGLQWMLADMATEIAAARGLCLETIRKRAAGERYSIEAAMAKLFASEMAGRVTDKALQIHGGYGFTQSYDVERYVRDARIMRIYEGTSEIQRNIIARSLIAD
ncbi:MAG: acyl-CoA dehydrogenase family protein [Alphaproteobacteria bacterium]|nr:acyl-CoA dehydrogenase family protein [Alphaproteobacteria bacterium]